MKILFSTLLGTFIFFVPLLSQNELRETATGGSFDQQANHILQHLDLTEVNTDLLLDKSMELLLFDRFDGTTLYDSNLVDLNVHSRAIAMLTLAEKNNNSPLPDPDVLYDNLLLPVADTMPISIICQRYNYFRGDAITLNLIDTIGGQLYDVPGRTQSPYLESTIFLAGVSNMFIESLDAYFRIDQAVFFNNLTTSASSVQIDWQNGAGFQTYQWGDVASVTWQNDGEKRPVVKYVLPNGTTYLSHFVLMVNSQTGSKNYSGQPDDTFPITVTINGETKGADINVFYGCENEGLLKPLIIVDGFDPRVEKNDNTWEGVRRLMEFDFTPNDLPLGEDLIEQGWDLIFVDWHDTHDYLENNAEVLEAVIDWANSEKATNGSIEKNVVIGMSMGGLVSKFCLRSMEIAGNNHDVEFFFPYDSPLRGANIPLGLQYMMKHVSNYQAGNKKLGDRIRNVHNETLTEIEGVVGSNAADQMLIYSAYRSGNEHGQFFTTLENMGPLQNCTQKAISNGSMVGTPLYPAGQKIFHGQGSTAQLSRLAGMNDPHNPWVDNVAEVLLWVIGTGVYFDIDVWSLNNKPTTFKKVYRGVMLTSILFIRIPNTLVIEVKGDGWKAVDSCPGGTTSLGTDLLPGFTSVHAENVHVPVVSALDIQSPLDDDVFFDVSDEETTVNSGATVAEGYVGSRGVSPFDIGVDDEGPNPNNVDNQEHVAISYRIAAYLLEELTTRNDLSSHLKKNNFNLNERIFNFGKTDEDVSILPGEFGPTSTTKLIKNSFTIEGAGEVWVNRGSEIAFINSDPENPLNARPQQFDVYIAKDNCENTPVILNIQNGGRFIIGDRNNTAYYCTF